MDGGDATAVVRAESHGVAQTIVLLDVGLEEVRGKLAGGDARDVSEPRSVPKRPPTAEDQAASE